MPELPEVDGVVEALKPVVTGKEISDVQVSETLQKSFALGKESIIKNSSPDAFAQALLGMTIEKIERRAKYIFFTMQKNTAPYVFVNHLGMTGAWFTVNDLADITEEKYRKHAHISITFSDGSKMIYSDIRRFGECRLLEKISDYPPLLQMAPEPFADEACEYFIAKTKLAKYQNKPIKAVIMDGHVISGCGNIYATESLFRIGMHPNRQCQRISDKNKRALFAEIVAVLQESLALGGSTISDYRNINGEAGGMQDRLQMYGKKHCPTCQQATKQVTIAGRTSTYCGHCQH